jgi:TctA family transporter
MQCLRLLWFLLALGHPGEALTAMMLSVFYVHNVVPGPQLFQNDMDFVVALYLALLMLNVLVLIFLLLCDQPTHQGCQNAQPVFGR